MEIRKFGQKHFSQIAEIYSQGIETGIATFETQVPDWETWSKAHLPECRIAAFEGETMAGWAALAPVSGRCVYAGVAEVSIYIAEKFRGKRIGTLLLQRLIAESEQIGLWTLQAGIFVENTNSITLHKTCGFRKIGFREKVGQLKGVWKDTVIMERRSKIVGV
ncbi:MAG: N-acetyltransferase [Saprospiraceae bacterium]|nr:N-acetyltransferase [Saprospiraceae bacterium]MBP7679869.1 N-acetyltransferase [Saprospiraceae bacterium]